MHQNPLNLTDTAAPSDSDDRAALLQRIQSRLTRLSTAQLRALDGIVDAILRVEASTEKKP